MTLRALAATAWLLLAACADTHQWAEKEKPWTQATVAHAERVQVQRADGTRIVLEHARIGDDEHGAFLAGRARGVPDQEIRIDLPDVQTLETWEKEPRNLAAQIAAGIVVLGAIVLYLLHGSSTT